MSDKNHNNRIAQQYILLTCLERAIADYSALGPQKIVKNITDKGSISPIDIIRDYLKTYGIKAVNPNDVQKFVNSVDSFLLTSMVPYINFIKPVNGNELRLHLLDLNRNSMRSFVGSTGSGQGSIGRLRETMGGVGVQKFDLEYLVNQESGYLFNLYKMNADIFFNSMEDVIQTISSFGGRDYTPVDVLIASTEDIHQYLLRSGSNPVISNLYRSFVEVGYAFDENFAKEDEVRTKWIEIVGSKTALSFESFITLIEKMKFVLEVYLYKWVWDVQENGNIILKLDYYGSDKGVGTTRFANILTDNRTLYKYNALISTKPTGETQKEQSEKSEENKKKANELKEKALLTALSGFYALNTMKQRTRVLRIPYSFLEIDFQKKVNALVNVNFFQTIADKKKIAILPLSAGFALQFDVYDFELILKNEKRADTQTTVEKREGTYDLLTGEEIESGEYVYVPFFYLGDMIEYFSGLAITNMTTPSEDGSTFLPPGSTIEIYLGMTEILVPLLTTYVRANIPLGAIPVSWDLFLKWWVDRIRKNTTLVYKFDEFISDFFSYFFKRALSSADNFGLSEVEFSSFSFLLPKDTNNDSVPRKLIYYLYTTKFMDRKPIVFYIGNKSGLMKSCKFTTEQDSYLSSFFMASTVDGEAPENNLQNQRAIYNVDIELFGNSLVVPGGLVEVVPTIVGANYSLSDRFKNLYDLGVGGLYNVTKCRVSFSNGEFTTSISAKYYGKPFSPRAEDDVEEVFKQSIFGQSSSTGEYEKSYIDGSWQLLKEHEVTNFVCANSIETSPASSEPDTSSWHEQYYFGE